MLNFQLFALTVENPWNTNMKVLRAYGDLKTAVHITTRLRVKTDNLRFHYALCNVLTCPWLNHMASTTPSTALSRSADSKTITGDFPPNSSDSFFPVPAVARLRSWPTWVQQTGSNIKSTLHDSWCPGHRSAYIASLLISAYCGGNLRPSNLQTAHNTFNRLLVLNKEFTKSVNVIGIGIFNFFNRLALDVRPHETFLSAFVISSKSVYSHYLNYSKTQCHLFQTNDNTQMQWNSTSILFQR